MTKTEAGKAVARLRLYRWVAEGKEWERRVSAYESDGLTRSDAQAVVDAEMYKESRGFFRVDSLSAPCAKCGTRVKPPSDKYCHWCAERLFGGGDGKAS